MPMALQPQAGFGSPQEEIDRLYDYMTKQIDCPDLHYVGTAGNKGTYQDGAYAGCLEEGWWPKKGEPCLGYSFGIDYEWSWDEGMEALGCQGQLKEMLLRLCNFVKNLPYYRNLPFSQILPFSKNLPF